MSRKMILAAVGVAALLGLLLGLGAGAANAATAPAWTSVGPSQVAGRVTAVTTLAYGNGKVAEYAFTYNGDKPGMFSRSNNESWARDGIAGAKVGEVVVAAKALGPNSVLLFTRISSGGGRVIQFTGVRERVNGGFLTAPKFTVLKTFGAGIGSASATSASDVWVFGAQGAAHTLGVWHYNGKTWTQVSKTFNNGSADSSNDAWAAHGTYLEHWNGSKWTATNIAGLLSSKTAIVSTMYAGGGGAPFALVSEKVNPTGSQVAVLEYTGKAWHKAGTYAPGSAVPGVAASDGAGGLWFSVTNGTSKPARLLHFGNAHRTLIAVPLAGLTTDSAGSAINGIAQVPGTIRELLGGDTVNRTGSNPITVKVYRLS